MEKMIATKQELWSGCVPPLAQETKARGPEGTPMGHPGMICAARIGLTKAVQG
jgi:hypothetical protein